MPSDSLFTNEHDEDQTARLVRKARDAPFLIIGLAGFVTILGIGAYKYKNRGQMSTSVYLMQLRVISQGAVVGCLTAGLAFAMAREYLFKEKPKDN